MTLDLLYFRVKREAYEVMHILVIVSKSVVIRSCFIWSGPGSGIGNNINSVGYLNALNDRYPICGFFSHDSMEKPSLLNVFALETLLIGLTFFMRKVVMTMKEK